MTRRQRKLAALGGAGLLTALIGAAGVTFGAFTGTTSNSGNSFASASAFGGPLRMASGTYTGNGVDNRSIAAGFQPNLVIIKGNVAQEAVARTSTMSGDASKQLIGTANLVTNRIQALNATGFQVGNDAEVNTNGTVYHWVAMAAGSQALKVASYAGNGTSQSISNVSFSPEYVAVLGATAARAMQRFNGMTTSFRFDAHTGLGTAITSLNAGGFSVGSAAEVNTNAVTYHYVAFNDVSGAIKAASYTGNNTDNRNFTGGTGVGFAPLYMMIRANDTGTARAGVHRGASLTGDSTLLFSAGVNAANLIQSLLSDGFQVGTGTDVNANTVTYHYLALRNSGGGCDQPGTQTLNASADSWNDQAAPTTNNGTATIMKVISKTPSLNGRALASFNLPAIPNGCSVTAATLRLNNASPVSGRTLEAYRNSTSWTEAGVNWNNQPATTGSAATAATPSSAAYMQWDVASQVQSMYSGSNFGFQVKDQTENGAGIEQQFGSREASANRPELVITFG